uniref:Uncharacterized protein n=1 Tax=Electrophorus electricus TaxID=8005 RepID=A0A4W4EL40_ELEEL
LYMDLFVLNHKPCSLYRWQWYYRKYIDVQKGGIGGLAMMIAGYCVLSYAWSYPHLSESNFETFFSYNIIYIDCNV